MQEVWKDIPGYEGEYQVSDLGQVKSVDRWVSTVNRKGTLYKRLLRGTILKQRNGDVQEHQTVRLSGANRKEAYVHILVAETFIGPRPPGMDVCHNDGNPRNNVLSNLRYDTRSNNNLDVIRSGRRMNPAALNINQVKEIKHLIAEGILTHRQIAKKFKVSPNCIWKINTGRTYSWLK